MNYKLFITYHKIRGKRSAGRSEKLRPLTSPSPLRGEGKGEGLIEYKRAEPF